MGYNLRSKRRHCFLKESFSSPLLESSQAKVVLQRLNLLETSDCDRFYVRQGKIIPCKSNQDESRVNNFWKILAPLMILIVFSFIWKDDLQTHSKELVKGSLNMYSEISVRVKETLSKYQKVFRNEMSHVKKRRINILHTVKSSLDVNKEIPHEVSENSVKEFVAVYVAKKKLLKDIDLKKNEHGFIEEQCKMEPSPQLADNIFTKNNENFANLFSNATDYALQSLGAKVLSTFDTEPYGVVTMKFWKYNFGILPKYFTQRYLNSKSPVSVLESWQKPGDCWAFKGFRGRVQIQFPKRIIITAVAMEHIPKNFSHGVNLSSAPKKFSVTGLEDVSSSSGKIHMGIFEYRTSGPHLQIFSLRPQLNTYFNGVEVSIDTNHGNKEYTCVYKIKIYGHE